MEAKVKSNPIMNFIRKILDKLSNSALFSVLSTDSSSTMGDEYLEDDDVLDTYKKQAATEAGLSQIDFKSIDQAFRTSRENVIDLEISTTTLPKEKGAFEVDEEDLEPDSTAEVKQRPAAKSIGDDERSL